MSNGTQDWFSQNAPKPEAQGGDWFTANAPPESSESSQVAARPDVQKQAKETLKRLVKPLIPGTGTVDPTGGFAAAQKSPRYQSYMKESGSEIGATAGAMATAPLAAGAKGLPWLTRLITRSGALGMGAGTGAVVGGASPKEGLETAVGTAALNPAFEAVTAVPGKLREFTGKEIAPAKAARLPVTAKEQPATAVTPTEVMQHASKEGIKLTRGQATGAPVARYAEALGERSIFGANQLAESMEENAGKFVKSVRNFADRVDPKAMGLSEEQAGESIAQSARTAKDVTHENASNAYKQLEWANRNPIETNPLTKKWMELRGSLPMGAEEQILAQVPRDQLALIDEILHPTEMERQMTFEQGIQLRLDI